MSKHFQEKLRWSVFQNLQIPFVETLQPEEKKDESEIAPDDLENVLDEMTDEELEKLVN